MTRMQSSRITALCVGLVALGALSGCSFFADQSVLEMPTLDREATEADVLPEAIAADLNDRAKSVLDLDTVRLVGVHADVQVFLARNNADYCFLLVGPKVNTDWMLGCAESPLMSSTLGQELEARTTMDSVIPADETGWVVLTEDVIVREPGADQ